MPVLRVGNWSQLSTTFDAKIQVARVQNGYGVTAGVDGGLLAQGREREGAGGGRNSGDSINFREPVWKRTLCAFFRFPRVGRNRCF